MTDQIVSRAHMRARGQAAFKAGRTRNDHGMNAGAPAIADWIEGWDDAYLAWAHAEAAEG